jgi:glycosyltransferase involved in cell wall biosynthesis
VSGFLIDQNATALAAGIERVLLLTPEKLTEIGEAARAATRRFSWKQVVPQYEQLYRDVIAVSKKPEARVS